ncbi:hypothetical protein NHH03_27515, partial [Stieleria sp. TO1_6]|uniref:hypothetical protein n=1 Tax=Stieleria tagensis TaxID=2956795 RepID=UPI00209B3B67
ERRHSLPPLRGSLMFFGDQRLGLTPPGYRLPSLRDSFTHVPHRLSIAETIGRSQSRSDVIG